jgi:hypothetical protein
MATIIKPRLHLFALAGFVLASALSACGGGSGTDSVKRDDYSVVPSPNSFNKYIGTYVENRCWSGTLQSGVPANIGFQFVLSASDKPNTLNFASTAFFYQADEPHSSNPECKVEVGSATLFGEVTYVGSLSSVEFDDGSKPPLPADKFQSINTNLTTKGQVGSGYDELSDYASGIRKGIWAFDGDNLYFGDRDFPLDAEGFPTKLNSYTYSIRQ